MKKISDYFGRKLLIVQKNFRKREYDLRFGEELIALLTYPKFFSDTAEFSMQNETLEFYKPSFFSSDTGIRKKGYRNQFAYFKSDFFGSKGVLELPYGIKLNFRIGIFRKQAEVYQGDNFILLITSRFSLKQQSDVIIQKRTDVLDEHPWIIMLGFYLSKRRSRNSVGG